VESWRIQSTPLNWQFNSGDLFELDWIPQFERLFKPFEISSGVVLPPGDYRFTRGRLRNFTASKRRVAMNLDWYFGGFWSGTAHEVDVSITYKLAPRLQTSWQLNQTFARLPQGNFVARVSTLSADYSLTPFVTFSNLVQFDNASRGLGWQSRFRWIMKPGNDLFIVFNQGWQQAAAGGWNFTAADTKLASKIQYTFRF